MGKDRRTISGEEEHEKKEIENDSESIFQIQGQNEVIYLKTQNPKAALGLKVMDSIILPDQG